MKELPLTKGMYALVDDEDYARISMYKWYVSKHRGITHYAVRQIRINKKKTAFYMHRVIMNPAPDIEIDHIDGNGLNNQKSNLRCVTHRENHANLHIKKTSRFVGVCWAKNTTDKHWKSAVRIGGKTKCLGYYRTEEEAHRAYISEIQFK